MTIFLFSAGAENSFVVNHRGFLGHYKGKSMCNPFEVPELVREQIMTFCKSNRPELIVPVFRFTHAVITAEDAEFRKLLDVSSDHAEFIEATGQFMALVPLSISLEVPQPLSRRIDPATILSGQVTSEDTKVIGEFRLENDEVKMLTFGRPQFPIGFGCNCPAIRLLLGQPRVRLHQHDRQIARNCR